MRNSGTIDRQTIHGQIGKGADMLIPTLLPEADAAERAAIADAHGRIFKTKYLAHAKPFPNARNLMAHAQKAGQTIVLASSASAEELDHYVDLLGARDLVTATTSSDDVEHTKPAPDIFVTALGKLPGIGCDEVIVIGDTPYDIEAALKSQIATVAVRSGASRIRLSGKPGQSASTATCRPCLTSTPRLRSPIVAGRNDVQRQRSAVG